MITAIAIPIHLIVFLSILIMIYRTAHGLQPISHRCPPACKWNLMRADFESGMAGRPEGLSATKQFATEFTASLGSGPVPAVEITPTG
jgi:hypothetical protein